MNAEALLRWMIDGTLAASIATAIVLALRIPLRRAFGPQVAYAAWALVPVALLVAMLPRPGAPALAPDLLAMHPGVLVAAAGEGAVAGAIFDIRHAVAAIWLLGILASAIWFGSKQRRFVASLGRLHRGADGAWRGKGVASPAVVGALRPRIVLPVDFEARFGREDAALVLAHERAHVARGDTRANLVAVAVRCLQWFNPLLHIAARSFRLDQELACDAAVVARHPHARRRYAGAMLNVQLAVPGLPVGCHWQSSQSLKERILMLKQSQPAACRRRAGALAVCVLVSATSYTAWAFRPADTAVPPVLAAQATAPAADRDASVDVQSRQLAPPRYPASAMESGLSGKVVMRILVGVDGSVRDVVVEDSQPAGVFDASAVEAARGWQFEPAIEDGLAVEGWIRVPIEYEYEPKAEQPAGEG